MLISRVRDAVRPVSIAPPGKQFDPERVMNRSQSGTGRRFGERRSQAVDWSSPPRMLIVPGLNGSGPEHWQSRWEREHGAARVEQRDWSNPDRSEWTATIEEAVAALRGPVLLVAHSLGCIAVAHWAASTRQQVAGAMLVAPADIERNDAPDVIRNFGPLPLAPLPFPSLLVGSRNDPYASLERARFFARHWGSHFVDAGYVGHLNVVSGHGPWPEGRLLLAELLTTLAQS